MYSNFEEKGKIFTQVITKVPIAVVVQTTANLIRGEIHIRPDERLKDALDGDGKPFVAITNAIILNAQNEEIYRAKFIILNREQIVWILPEDEINQAGES